MKLRLNNLASDHQVNVGAGCTAACVTLVADTVIPVRGPAISICNRDNALTGACNKEFHDHILLSQFLIFDSQCLDPYNVSHAPTVLLGSNNYFHSAVDAVRAEM